MTRGRKAGRLRRQKLRPHGALLGAGALSWVLSEHILGYFAVAAGLLAEAGPFYGP